MCIYMFLTCSNLVSLHVRRREKITKTDEMDCNLRNTVRYFPIMCTCTPQYVAINCCAKLTLVMHTIKLKQQTMQEVQ